MCCGGSHTAVTATSNAAVEACSLALSSTSATGQITAVDTITVELVEADETPAVVIVRWSVKPTVLHPRRFPDTASIVVRLFAEAATRLASIKANRRL